jgi:hypothetical protein
LLLWWSLLSTLRCKLPPASSTIAALETTEIYLVSTKFLLMIPAAKKFSILLPLLEMTVGFQVSNAVHHIIVSPPSPRNGHMISYTLQ